MCSKIEYPTSGRLLSCEESIELRSSLKYSKKRNGVSRTTGKIFLDNLGFHYRKNNENTEKELYRCHLYAVGSNFKLCNAWVHTLKRDTRKIYKAHGFPHSHPSPKFDPVGCSDWMEEQMTKRENPSMHCNPVNATRRIDSNRKMRTFSSNNGKHREALKIKRGKESQSSESSPSPRHVNHVDNVEEVQADVLIKEEEETNKGLNDTSTDSDNFEMVEQLKRAKEEYESIRLKVRLAKSQLDNVKQNKRAIAVLSEEIHVVQVETVEIKQKEMALSVFNHGNYNSLKQLKFDFGETMLNKAHPRTLYTWCDWKLCLLSDKELVIMSESMIIKISANSSPQFHIISMNNLVYKLNLDEEKFGVYKLILTSDEIANIQVLRSHIQNSIDTCTSRSEIINTISFQDLLIECAILESSGKGLTIKSTKSNSFAVLHKFINNGFWVVPYDQNIFRFAVSE